MILRVIRGRGSRADVAALRVALDAALRPNGGERRGPERFHLGSRSAQAPEAAADELEVIVVSHWVSAEVARTFDAAQESPLSFARRHLEAVEVVHFEVDDTIRRHSDEHPAAIRIATGRFSKPGADAEMQNILRQRVPEIGDEMGEAWVGRRIMGREVEVTFVSAWRRLPTDRALEQAFWPDIALRYDTFDVEVYSTVE